MNKKRQKPQIKQTETIQHKITKKQDEQKRKCLKTDARQLQKRRKLQIIFIKKNNASKIKDNNYFYFFFKQIKPRETKQKPN